MANEEQVNILKQGVEVWNKWREENPDEKVDLSEADLSFSDNLNEVNLSGANLSEANLKLSNLVGAVLNGANLRRASLWLANCTKAHLRKADLWKANLKGINLSEADVTEADLTDSYLREAYLREANLFRAVILGADLIGADLQGANLREANLRIANLNLANLSGADLRKSDLRGAILEGTGIEKAKLSGSLVYGVSVWDLIGEFSEQKDLVITPTETGMITVDNIKIAQFVYLILDNEEIRDVINTLTSKSVLILGRFAIPERKAILDALRNKLREYDLLPIVFDFDRPTDKDFTETIKTLAGISYFVIADITNPKSSPLELQATVPDYQIPFVPIIQEGERPFSMMADLHQKYPWVLPTRSYDSIETLMSALKPGIIDPAVEMRNKLRLVKAQEHPTESLKDYLDKSL